MNPIIVNLDGKEYEIFRDGGIKIHNGTAYGRELTESEASKIKDQNPNNPYLESLKHSNGYRIREVLGIK